MEPYAYKDNYDILDAADVHVRYRRTTVTDSFVNSAVVACLHVSFSLFFFSLLLD